MDENICRFIEFRRDIQAIHTINFVLETKPQLYEKLISESVYKMYLVISGEGILHTAGKRTALNVGDIFFTFPGNAFAIETVKNFKYMYISFVGLRSNMIMERLKISNRNFVFNSCDELCDFWKRAISLKSVVSDLISESVLLYTFAFLGDRLLMESSPQKSQEIVKTVKKYVDEHFSDCDFSLDNMSKLLSYNKKYISYIFKKNFNTGIIEYLNTIRVQNACTMMQQGFTSVSDIAEKCGYRDSQYFSRIFKSKTGLAPKKYMESLQRD